MAKILVRKQLGPNEEDGLVRLSFQSTGAIPLDESSLLPVISNKVTPNGASNSASPETGIGVRVETSRGPVWVQGNSVLCLCPDCQTPISIRLWLMIADCWKCGASIELSDEQIAEIESSLGTAESSNRREQNLANSAEDLFSAAARSVADPRGESLQSPSPAVEPSVSLARTNSRRTTKTRAYPSKFKRRESSLPLRLTPAWIASLLAHLLILLVLALITWNMDDSWDTIFLSSFVSTDEKKEGEIRLDDIKKEIQDDLPLPMIQDKSPEEIREMVVKADQDARELQLDPNPIINLPDERLVRDRIAGTPGTRPIFAARDPRLRAEIVKQEGGTLLTEAAVSRGLRWLADHQNEDGSWSLRNYDRSQDPNNQGDSAATSLALLPFLGAGQTHEFGMYKDNVSRGLRWLIRHQNANSQSDQFGDLRINVSENEGMYAHGQATIVLIEALALSGDERFREPAQRAVDFIVRAQNNHGGWRYRPLRPNEAGDTSVFGWQMMALQSARSPGVGLRVPDETLKLASYYLDQASSNRGSRYRYQPDGGEPKPSMTAEALLCRVYLGWHRDDPRLQEGLDWLLEENGPRVRSRDLYYWYYATQVFHHYGGEEWKVWNKDMRDLLVAAQQKDGKHAGSWPPEKFEWGEQGGRIYTTAFATCILEVYYRHLPLFKQLELGEAGGQ